MKKTWLTILLLAGVISQVIPDTTNLDTDKARFPTLPDGFEISLLASEPLIRNPTCIAFDRRGRAFVAQGPQFRKPKKDTPGDSIKILIDHDDDGVADEVKTFARGFNSIHGLAWKGNDLYVANAPDFTVVRDTDGDDVADEYIRIYTDLGNVEHSLHGLNWGPDGKLYMSKGNSKGLTQPGRIAPKPFRELWGVESPAGAPDLPPAKTFTPETYRNTYHHPSDDWGREGGILRCDPMGKNLEITSRGFRNPWDMAMNDTFDFIGTDNDQNEGDKIFMPFFGAHFGWGHTWSYNWSDGSHLPTAPHSGPFFNGSGTGVIYYSLDKFPKPYRNVFFINDWGRKCTYVMRPRPHNIGAFASPVVDEKHVAIRLWKLVERVVNHAGSGAVEKRSAMRCGRQVTAVGPVVAPCVPPAEVRAEERHENLVTFVLIIVRADEIEGVIHRHVPRVAKPSAGDLEVFAHGIASQDATLAAPVVRRMVVCVAVSFRCKRLGRRQVWGAGWRLDSPEFAEWLGGNPARLREALGVALGHVELAVRSPVKPVQRVLYVAEVGVNADVLVCDIVPVGVPHNCEVGRVGDVQIVALPCQPVNAVEAAGECFDLVGDTVVVVVDEDFNRVSGGVLLWFAKLRSLRDERPSTAVERNAGGIANEWFAG